MLPTYVEPLPRPFDDFDTGVAQVSEICGENGGRNDGVGCHGEPEPEYLGKAGPHDVWIRW